MILFNAHRRSRVPPIVIGAVVGSRILEIVNKDCRTDAPVQYTQEVTGSPDSYRGRRWL